MSRSFKPKVLFLYQGVCLPSSRVRVLNLIPELVKCGIEATAVEYPDSVFARLSLLRRIQKYDVVFLQKKLLSFAELLLLRANSKKLIFDFDDAIFYRDNPAKGFESNRRQSRFNNIISRADFVVAGTRFLANAVQVRNSSLAVIPSAVPVDVAQKDYTQKPGFVAIGWIGGKGNLFNLDFVAESLRNLSNKYPLKLHVICDSAYQCEGVEVVNIPWSLETQEQEIAKFDIGIMPLENNLWAQGKCGYKALQYMASAVPAIVSDVGGNVEHVVHGVNGLVAPDWTSFESLIESLIQSPEVRMEMGLRARQTVLECCSVEVVSRRLYDTILKLLK